MVKIITDSNSGISRTLAYQLDIKIIPMPIIINQKTYFEGVDLDNKQFYDFLKADNEIHTSKPLLSDLINCFNDVLSSGYDEILYIPMSSGLSSSYETTALLKEEFADKIEVVDNHRISVTLKASVFDAIELKNKGYSARQIKQILEDHAFDSYILVAVDDTKMLLKGGRSKGLEGVCQVLHIKPILKIEGEKLELYRKCRTFKLAVKKIIEEIKIKSYDYDIKEIDYRIGYASSIQDSDLLTELASYLKDAFPYKEIYYDPLTFSISAHVGYNAFGVGISAKVDDSLKK